MRASNGAEFPEGAVGRAGRHRTTNRARLVLGGWNGRRIEQPVDGARRFRRVRGIRRSVAESTLDALDSRREHLDPLDRIQRRSRISLPAGRFGSRHRRRPPSLPVVRVTSRATVKGLVGPRNRRGRGRRVTRIPCQLRRDESLPLRDIPLLCFEWRPRWARAKPAQRTSCRPASSLRPLLPWPRGT